MCLILNYCAARYVLCCTVLYQHRTLGYEIGLKALVCACPMRSSLLERVMRSTTCFSFLLPVLLLLHAASSYCVLSPLLYLVLGMLFLLIQAIENKFSLFNKINNKKVKKRGYSPSNTLLSCLGDATVCLFAKSLFFFAFSQVDDI